MTTTISERTRRVLFYLKAYKAAYDSAPTYREIAVACGLSTTSLARYHLDLLERAGLIKRRPNVARGIVIVDGVHSERSRGGEG